MAAMVFFEGGKRRKTFRASETFFLRFLVAFILPFFASPSWACYGPNAPLAQENSPPAQPSEPTSAPLPYFWISGCSDTAPPPKSFPSRPPKNLLCPCALFWEIDSRLAECFLTPAITQWTTMWAFGF